METKVEEYVDKIGLGGIVSQDVGKYLNCSREDMKGLSAEECSEASILLSRESMFIQNEINRLQNKMDWAKFRLDQLIANEIDQYDKYMKDEYKRHLISRNSSAALEYHNIINEAQRYICRLSFIPTNLKQLSDLFSHYGFSKRKAIESSRGY